MYSVADGKGKKQTNEKHVLLLLMSLFPSRCWVLALFPPYLKKYTSTHPHGLFYLFPPALFPPPFPPPSWPPPSPAHACSSICRAVLLMRRKREGPRRTPPNQRLTTTITSAAVGCIDVLLY